MSVSLRRRVYHGAVGLSLWVQRHSGYTQDLRRGVRRRVGLSKLLRAWFNGLGGRHNVDSVRGC